MTFTEVTNDDPELTRNGRWYEWVPNEVFETMANCIPLGSKTFRLHIYVYGYDYTGVSASSIRARIETEMPILEFDSELYYEYNPEIKTFVVYTSDSFPSGTVIGTVKLDTSAAEVGEYPVGLTVIDATDGDAKKAEVTEVSGTGIITTDALKGDLNRDGEVNNADLVMLVRYLVELETFDAEQLIFGDYNSDGTIDNRDLFLLARYLVGLEDIDNPSSLN